jgi:beta-lactam-binding protein with PASTA domain
VKTLLSGSIQPILEKVATKNPDEDGMILSQNTAAGTVIPKNTDLRLQVGVYGEDDLEREKYDYHIFSYMLGSLGTVQTNGAAADPLAGQTAVRVLLSDERDQQQEILTKTAVPNELIIVTFKAYGKAKISLIVNNNFVKEVDYGEQ